MKVHEMVALLSKMPQGADVMFLVAGDDEGFPIKGVNEGVEEDEGIVWLTEDTINE